MSLNGSFASALTAGGLAASAYAAAQNPAAHRVTTNDNMINLEILLFIFDCTELPEPRADGGSRAMASDFSIVVFSLARMLYRKHSHVNELLRNIRVGFHT